jgi:molybdopterin molybdotransferase
MNSFDDALAMVLDAFRPLPAEIVGLHAGLGRALAEDVASRTDHPPADVSAMDGYALRAADVADKPEARLRLIGRAAAGAAFPGRLAAGEAVRIFTGAQLPDGADSIVIQERAQERDGTVLVEGAPMIGRWIRRRGQDFSRGDILLQAGRRLTSRHLALAAAMDAPWLKVRRKPRVAVLSTGDELVRPGERRTEAQLVESGGTACATLLRAWGAEPVVLGIARDDDDELAAMIRMADGCDLLITIGGVSVGDPDRVRRVLDAAGFKANFHGVAIRPGKPLLFGRLGTLPVLGLPGNPVSAWVTGLLFGCPAVGIMLGLNPPGLTPGTAVCGDDLPGNDGRRDHLRATLSRQVSGETAARVLPGQDSAMIHTLARADGLIIRPPLAPPVKAGERVPILRFKMPEGDI